MHNLKEYQRNKISDILKQPNKRPSERQWQQMQVMLPILKSTGAMNLERNDYTKRKLSEDGKAELNRQIIYSRAQLAELSITK